MSEASQRSRAPIQRLADQASGWFVPVVILIALLAFGAWSIWGPEPRLAFGLVAAVTVLIIACPCASLGFATPMSIMVGVDRGAHAGGLKTGTLTEGKPKVVTVAPAGFDENSLLRLAASVEAASEHPLALAIVAAAKERAIPLSPVKDFDSPTGKRACGTVEDKHILLGKANFLLEQGVAANSAEQEAERLRQDGATAIFVAVDAGIIAIADPVKATTLDALKTLSEGGLRIIGDARDAWWPWPETGQ